MNAQERSLPVSGAAETSITSGPAVDESNPWLGLASFTEETRSFFYGREEEVAELARRVQRKLLTVLFGQSGLGKTSILRAGLVPRLRGEGYCPVYVRIDYDRDAPEPAEQIKQAIARTARRSGEWTQVGVAVEGESLWEFLHHRDDVLLDESGKALIPLLIFDQFEEIFTLAQTDDFKRARAARFIADLADLVENRPPREVERRLEEDDEAAERFDFARGDYRVLIALREDYLAPLEGLKTVMPSVTQNRLRLAPMTGRQALQAVLRPGKRLVNEEVAAAIVRFVAGGAEIANAEVEPSLLSLICRELNDTRLAQSRSEISLDLLEGSHASILSNFYERCLVDQPAAVRRLIEDELLTDSGFRENVAEEKLLGSFAAAGAAADTLAVLVNRRLLRIEERLDVRRVELTHDVLCGVVKASRELRQAREARDASERQLAEQRERAQLARESMLRARKIAAICSVLSVIAVLAAILAYISTQRAKRAERLADQTRNQAEHLLGYLTDDFARELGAIGRLDMVAELAKRQVDYFNALPAELRGPETTRNGALAMYHYAAASRRMNRLPLAEQYTANSIRLLAGLRAAGDRSEETSIALALATDTQAAVFFDFGRPDTDQLATQALGLLTPFAESAHPSLATSRAYAEILNNLGYLQMRSGKYPQGAETLAKCMRVAEAAGARTLEPPDIAAQYAYAGGWLIEALDRLGRREQAQQVAVQAGNVVKRLIERRPGDLFALRSQQLIFANNGFGNLDNTRPAEGVTDAQTALQASRTILQLDPNNSIALHNLSVDLQLLADAQWELGHPEEANEEYRETISLYENHEPSPSSLGFFLFHVFLTSEHLADAGNVAGAAPIIAEGQRHLETVQTQIPDKSLRGLFTCNLEEARIAVALRSGEPAVAKERATKCLGQLAGVKPRDGEEQRRLSIHLFVENYFLGKAEYLLGNFGLAEKALRDSVAARSHLPVNNAADEREGALPTIYLALSLAMHSKLAEAGQVIQPMVKLYDSIARENKGDEIVNIERASVLFVYALTDPARRVKLLAEARRLIDAAPEPVRRLRSTLEWRERIVSAVSSG